MDVAMLTLYVPLIAVALDLILADPAWLPHPVRWIGLALEKIEPRLRGLNISLKTAGILAAVVLCLAVYFVVRLVCAIPVLGVLATLYFAWAGLALGGLLKEGRKVARLADEGRIEAAREALALLVSRDTSEMDVAKIRSSLAETLSENLNDGFVAPFMFLCIFGPAGMWVYKTISTMDSMWGYKTEEYKDLGWFGARADDVLAFIPARVTAFLMLGAGWFLKLDVNGAYDHMREDAQKSESPNAGWPMAAASWLLGAAVGGPTAYFGEIKDKPQIGPDGQWDAEKILRLLRLTLYSGILGAVAVALYFCLVYLAKQMRRILVLIGILAAALGILGRIQAEAYFGDHPLNRMGADFMEHMEAVGHLSREVRFYLFFEDHGLLLALAGLGLAALAFFLKSKRAGNR